MNIWELEIKQGWIVGLSLVSGLLLLTVGMLIGALTIPISFWTFLMGLTACSALLAAIYTAYLLWGLAHAGYEMDRNVILIDWGDTRHQIPMAAVRSVLSGADISALQMRPGLRWPGYFVGFGETEAVGPLLFYATTPLEQQVIVRTETMAYAISPSDREAFLQALHERLEMGATQEIKEHTTYPQFLDWSIWKDRWAGITLGGSAGILLLLVGLLCACYPLLPADLVMRYTATGEALLVAPAWRIFYLALLGVIFWLLNGSLGLLLYLRQRAAAYFLWSGLVLLQLSLWIAAFSILLHLP